MCIHQERLVIVPYGINPEDFLGFKKEFSDKEIATLEKMTSKFFSGSFLTDYKGKKYYVANLKAFLEILGLAYTSSSPYAGLWICNNHFSFGCSGFYMRSFVISEESKVYLITENNEEVEKIYFIGGL